MQTSGACLLRAAKPASPQCRRFVLGGQAGMRREPTNPMHSALGLLVQRPPTYSLSLLLKFDNSRV